ncbi:MAG: neutral/alkaline non-lysosomal ceramidase N-terminal domain-containing protein [Actinobacteria bacterium]|nr:neutral/alkaline non-lysosomal ceramidase N-terminal domain-containing protein [Actinomycetota bacterium]
MARQTTPLAPFLETSGRRPRAQFSVVPEPAVRLVVEQELLAGAAEVDITPPPGMPKAGYSANAYHGTGFRTRLRARVLHLRTGVTSVALVQCDLLGGSAVVQHLVAQAIRDRTDVPLAGLFIGATHTHAGPGQFLGTDFYNRFASNKSGFDPVFTQFLVDRIAAGVVDAVEARAPAKLASGAIDVWGLTRNRSMAAHVRNRNIGDTRTAAERKFLAVNPWLHLLRVDRVRGGADEPLAAMVVFSVHGTGVPMSAHEYNADIWAYLVRELGDRIEAQHRTRPVVGAVEGTHADVAPAIRPGSAGHLEAARVGRAVGARAFDLYESLACELADRVELQAGFREIDLTRDVEIDGVRLPGRPAVGAALIAGAHENETPVIRHVPPFKPDTPKPFAGKMGNPHREKWIIGSRWLQPIVLPLHGFPRVLPIQTIRVGDAMIVGLPFEITVESGRRIEAAVRDATGGSGIDRVVVSSVANEYSGYVASPEEYQQQRYEGAHTLYGPATQPFLAKHAAQLAAMTVKGDVVQEAVPERRFDLRVRHHLPRSAGGETRVTRRLLGHPRYHDATATSDGYWSLDWLDVAPPSLCWHEPLVKVEASEGGSWVTFADDQGWALQVTHLGPDAGEGHRYEVRWWDPTFRGTRPFRFVLLANGGQPELISPPFP